MRVLRVTRFMTDSPVPLTLFAPVSSFRLDEEQTIKAMKQPLEGDAAFVACRTIEVEDGASEVDIAAAAITDSHTYGQREQDQAMLYSWDAAQFPKVVDGGMVSGTRPAPLSVEEIKDVFDQLSQHPGYRSFTLQTISEDHKLVRRNADGTFYVG